MYTISNQTRAEINTLLAALTKLEGIDTRTANLRRRAKLSIGRLEKAPKQDYKWPRRKDLFLRK